MFPSYSPLLNQIFFPSGILQNPFFDVTFPHAINFGSIGSVFGHELAHGFIGKGRLFQHSNENFPEWLRNIIIQRLEKRSKCFVKQYSKYKIHDQTLDGTYTLSKYFSF